jgi:glycine/sarcosine N-methyltransferase
MMEARDFYDGLGDDYDRLVSWQARLAREQLFFNRLFDENGTRSVLDAACGTGMHAIAFARRGMSCAGADLSPAMIGRARENASAAGVAVDFQVAAFGELAQRFAGPFDALTCLGNSLPHLPDDSALTACLAEFSRLLRPGGLLIIQNRNYDRVLRERQRFMPLASRSDEEGETLFLRISDFADPEGAAQDAAGAYGAAAERIDFTIVTLKKRAGAWTQSVQTTPLRALRRATMEKALAAARFSSLQLYGSYAMIPFDSPDAADLVAVARK